MSTRFSTHILGRSKEVDGTKYRQTGFGLNRGKKKFRKKIFFEEISSRHTKAPRLETKVPTHAGVAGYHLRFEGSVLDGRAPPEAARRARTRGDLEDDIVEKSEVLRESEPKAKAVPSKGEAQNVSVYAEV